MKSKNRDYVYIERIEEHYSFLNSVWKKISKDEFVNECKERDSILFRLLQIGELVSHLSKDLQDSVDKKDFRGVIDTRNVIVHGYHSLKNDQIINTIEKQLKPFIDQLKKNVRIIYDNKIKSLIGKRITLLVDELPTTEKPYNSGHIRFLADSKSQLQKVILLDVDEPLFQCECYVVAAIKCNDENNYVLLATITKEKHTLSSVKEMMLSRGINDNCKIIIK